jgi:hypothetical protein
MHIQEGWGGVYFVIQTLARSSSPQFQQEQKSQFTLGFFHTARALINTQFTSKQQVFLSFVPSHGLKANASLASMLMRDGVLPRFENYFVEILRAPGIAEAEGLLRAAEEINNPVWVSDC